MLQLIVDVLLIWLALWLAFFIRLGDARIVQPLGDDAWLFTAAPLTAIPLFIRYGLYRAVMRYLGPPALTTIPRLVTAADHQTGRAAWRERGCQYVKISVVAGSLKKQT